MSTSPLTAPALWTLAARERSVVLLLVRHGQTEWNATHRFLGRTDVPLDATGRAQAARLANGVPGPLAGVYSSPLSRALDTARAVHPAPTVVADLAELDQGELEGLDGPTAIARYPAFFEHWQRDPATARVPGGECLAAVQSRALSALAAVAEDHAPGAVVGLFTHQMVIASTTCAVRGEPLTRWRAHRVGNTQATALAWQDGQFRVLVQRAAFAPEDADA